MKANKRKGFTLVELLVVIAILAVLATVSVIGYLSFTNKAKESNDISLTTQMNLALQANEAVDGKAKTMTDALNVLSDAGLDVTKLTPTSQGYSYLWDSLGNRMVLVDENKELIAPENYVLPTTDKLYTVISNETEMAEWSNYSIYLGNEFSDEDNSITISTSIDTGSNNIAVTYIGSTTRSAVIRTNGNTLTINAPNDSIDHYGFSENIDIMAIANNSYHEYGDVQGYINLNSGHVVLESGSSVSAVVVTSNDVSTVSIEDKSSNNVSVSATNSDVASKLETVVTGTENILSEGVHESELEKFSGGFGTEQSPYLISTEEELLNIATFEEASNNNVKLINDILLINQLIISNGNIILDMDGHTITFTCDATHNAAIIDLTSNAHLTITGNGVFNFNDDYLNYPSIGITVRTFDNSKLIVESGNFYCGLTFAQCDDSSTCEIRDGYFNTFATWEDVYWTLNLIDNTNATIVVYGGTFDMYNPAESHTENPVANFVAEGYVAVRINGPTDDTFSYVVKKAK